MTGVLFDYILRLEEKDKERVETSQGQDSRDVDPSNLRRLGECVTGHAPAWAPAHGLVGYCP